MSDIAERVKPCTLALDNLENLTDPGSADVLNTLLRDAPPNLHLVMACRELPFSLDFAEPLLKGRVVMLSAPELHFLPQEAAAFLRRHPTRQELNALDQQFEGWPIALALHSNFGHGSKSSQAVSFKLLGNWIDTRLLERLSSERRDFLLDDGLLDRLDSVQRARTIGLLPQ